MKRESLKVEKRKILGKKIKKLRREGVLPANVYGKDIKSQAVQAAFSDFEKVYKEVGETGLVDLNLESVVIPVLIHNVQKDYRNNVLHADFFKVNLKEKVKTSVPLEFVGEPKAVTDKIGLLMPIHSEVEIEALPDQLPEKIEVSVEHLANVDEQITVADIKSPEGVTILTDPSQIVVKIGELVSKETQEQLAEEAAKAEEAKAEEAEAAEGEAKEVKEEAEEAKEEGEKPQEEEPKEAPKE